MSELFLITLVGMSLPWLAFEKSKARISLQIYFIVTNLKEKHSEEFLASLILRTLAWWEKSSIALSTGLSLISDNMGGLILRVSTIFSKWFLNILITSFSSVITLSPSTRVILSSLRSCQYNLAWWFAKIFYCRLFSSHWDYCRNSSQIFLEA